MTAVFKRELRSYFTGMTGYVFSAFLLLFAGIYTVAYNLKSGYANFEYVLSGMSFVFLVAIPLLTMRSLAEEKRQRTDQLLYSLPLTMTQVVLGKYLAMLALLLVPLAVISVYPLVLTAYGELSLRCAYGALVGFFFLGAALTAVGLFVSSVTENQAIAAGLCFAALLVNYFLPGLASFLPSEAAASFLALGVIAMLLALAFYLMTKSGLAAGVLFILLELCLFAFYLFRQDSFAGLLPDIMDSLCLFSRFDSFVNGIFDITALVFYASVAGAFIFLSVQSMEKRRWS